VNSLRGFDDNEFLASAYAFFTLEVRFLMARNSNLYGFSDAGWYKRETSSGHVDNFPVGFGLGSHIYSGSGIFYINYALGKQSDTPFNLGSAKIHLGFIAKF
jgi:hemolysin activation/secretion protein